MPEATSAAVAKMCGMLGTPRKREPGLVLKRPLSIATCSSSCSMMSNLILNLWLGAQCRCR